MKEPVLNEFPRLLANRCNVLYLTLLDKDRTRFAIMNHVIEVQNYFRTTQQSHVCILEYLKETLSATLKLLILNS